MERREFLAAVGGVIGSVVGCTGPGAAGASATAEQRVGVAESVDCEPVDDGPATDVAWPSHLGGAGNAGFNPVASLPDCPEIQWTWENPRVDQPGRTAGMGGGPAVADGTVFVPDGSHFEPRAVPTDVDGNDDPRRSSLVALDAATGAVRWRYDSGSDVRTTPAVAGGTVFAEDRGSLHAVDAATGERRWVREAGSHSSCDIQCNGFQAPAAVDGTVYAANRNGTLSALDAESGAVRWRFEADGMSARVYRARRRADDGEVPPAFRNGGFTAPPAVADETVYAVSYDSRVYAVDAATGEEHWRYSVADADHLTDRVWDSATVADGTVYVGTRFGRVIALDAATGEERWRFSRGPSGGISPTVADGRVYAEGGANDQEKYLYALDAASSTVLWRLPGGVVHPPTAADGLLLVGSTARAAGTGEKRWTLSGVRPGSPVVPVDGALFVHGHENGNVYALW